MIAFETSHFLKESERLKSDLTSLSLSNLQGMKDFLNAVVEMRNQYKSSFILRYLDPKTEIRVHLHLLWLITALELYLQATLLPHYPISRCIQNPSPHFSIRLPFPYN